MAQVTENSGPGKKRAAGQSPAARIAANKAAKYGAPAMSPADRKKLDRIPGQSPLARKAARKAAITHVVKSGDTLSAIAKKNNLTVAQLKKWNPVAAERGIFAGSKIKLSGPTFRKTNKQVPADRGTDKGMTATQRRNAAVAMMRGK